ncbi:hypothetical protein PV08_02697 [Exophiala spinifera]|uniref:Uncharacterized protein n=1 Tax=Exophiala spinifera TaxID=91928 RepID=A0A0D2C466_9EURO|nr:uncharacterized protein PV08_02697 [Exophiala spinifera]KIW18409.1 hypothetical protein PV08_02697 [Exophiala spinifera]
MEQRSELPFEIRAFLQHDLDQDASLLTAVLIEIRGIIQEREELAARIPLCIKEKGEKDKNQLKQLFSYQGPDHETERILNQYGDLWMDDPNRFWNTPLLSGSQRFGCTWTPECTDAVRTVHNLDRSPEEIERDVKYMANCGGRYLNLEKSLGRGSSLLLGLDIAESIWTKTLPKSGKVHDAVMNHIRTTQLTSLVNKFGLVRKLVVERELENLSAMHSSTLVGSLLLPQESNTAQPDTALPTTYYPVGDTLYELDTDVDWEQFAEWA